MEILSEEAIAQELAELPGWSRSGNEIATTVQLKDFRAAMLFAARSVTWPRKPITTRT